MSQNFAAATAKLAAGGVGYPSLDANGNLLVAQAENPSSATPVAATSGPVAAAVAVAAIPAVAGKTSYVSGLAITGSGATAASVVYATLSGLIGPVTFDYIVPVPAGVSAAIAPITVYFNPPLPASAVDQAITLTLPSLGSGNTDAAVNIWGFHE